MVHSAAPAGLSGMHHVVALQDLGALDRIHANPGVIQIPFLKDPANEFVHSAEMQVHQWIQAGHFGAVGDTRQFLSLPANSSSRSKSF